MEKVTTKIFGYVRVSSKEQNLARQIDSLKQYVPDERDIYADKLSGILIVLRIIHLKIWSEVVTLYIFTRWSA